MSIIHNFLSSALFRDPRTLLELHVEESAKSTIDIFSSSGFKLCSIPVRSLALMSAADAHQWTKARVVGLGWSAKEELVECTEDGVVFLYDIHGEFVRTFSLAGRVSHVVSSAPHHRAAVGDRGAGVPHVPQGHWPSVHDQRVGLLRRRKHVFGPAMPLSPLVALDDPKPRKMADYPSLPHGSMARRAHGARSAGAGPLAGDQLDGAQQRSAAAGPTHAAHACR